MRRFLDTLCRNTRPLMANASISGSFVMIIMMLLLGSCHVQKADIIVYGNTSAGVAAAVEAKQLGYSVIMVGPDTHLGGLSSSGLGWTDSGNKAVIGGLAREFYQRIKAKYDKEESWVYEKKEDCRYYKPDQDAVWVFEPHIAEKVFEDLVRENKIPVFRDHWLDREKGVKIQEGHIRSISMYPNGRTNSEIQKRATRFRGTVFIDATYEGDLMAMAGISYTIGREGNKKYNETLNGVNTLNDRYHNFDLPVDPYIRVGDSTSGLLPRISGSGPGEEGSGDHRIQAYCFRMCLTKVPENRIPFPQPENYDPLQYELLARYFDAGFRNLYPKFDKIPNNKTDTNNSGGFSTDNIGMNYGYPEGSYEERELIIEEHENYQKGLMWFMANDPRVPEEIRNGMSEWGLAKDEFIDNGHWPHQIYVREARRMVSDFVMTENHLRGLDETPDPIGMGSYNMDSHHVQRYVDANGHARNEGDVEVNPGGPYSISYRAITPAKNEAENLLVPVCLSSSHIAYGSIRMEPVFMILAQSAANAAALSIEEKKAIQDIDYSVLAQRLRDAEQVLLLQE